LPLTINGKVDKKSLPEPDFTGSEEYVAPDTETEKQLVKVWGEVLKLDPDTISMKNNFFDTGGNSLNATTLSNRIFRDFGIKFSVKNIFIMPVLNEMAEEIETEVWLKKKADKKKPNKVQVKI
ncbi:MAG: phosphopantetheine-binding protein, partial [Cyclobacteriaceae bacterium]